MGIIILRVSVNAWHGFLWRGEMFLEMRDAIEKHHHSVGHQAIWDQMERTSNLVLAYESAERAGAMARDLAVWNTRENAEVSFAGI